MEWDKINEHWIRIEDRDTWLIKLKSINPADEFKYSEYWSGLKRKCIEGVWNKDFDGYRYMTGNLFFYINFCVIIDTDKRTKSRVKTRPTLSDLEWELSYMMLGARGFAGWEDDDEFTSSNYHKIAEDNGWIRLDLIPAIERLDDTYKPWGYWSSIYDSKGNL